MGTWDLYMQTIILGWINNKVLLYSTGSSIHHPVINHKGKEYEKEYVYICIIESLFCIPETNRTETNRINYQIRSDQISRSVMSDSATP